MGRRLGISVFAGGISVTFSDFSRNNVMNLIHGPILVLLYILIESIGMERAFLLGSLGRVTYSAYLLYLPTLPTRRRSVPLRRLSSPVLRTSCSTTIIQKGQLILKLLHRCFSDNLLTLSRILLTSSLPVSLPPPRNKLAKSQRAVPSDWVCTSR